MTTILITGASDGIGLALAQRYRSAGALVIGVGRRAPATIEAAARRDDCRVDLAQPFAAAIVSAFLARRGVARLDLLIHSAGIGSYGPVESQTADAIDALLDTNLRAPIALTHALLPLLAAVGGKVVFIGSVAAALPAPQYAVYGASKAAIAGFARSLRVELRGTGVAVQTIHPGATRTAMHAKIGAPLAQIGHRRFPPPERVAAQIVSAIAGTAPTVVIGVGNRLLYAAGRRLGALVDRVAR